MRSWPPPRGSRALGRGRGTRRGAGALPAALLVVAGACGGGAPRIGDDGSAPRAPGSALSAGTGATQPPAVPRSGGSPDGARPNGFVPAPEFSAPRPAALPEELTSPEHRRYQQLRVETLRLMIEAARRALPVGPFQERIDAASTTAVRDVSEAGDRMAEIAADLRQAITDSGR